MAGPEISVTVSTCVAPVRSTQVTRICSPGLCRWMAEPSSWRESYPAIVPDKVARAWPESVPVPSVPALNGYGEVEL